jgi:hypothetical protein
VTLLAVVVGGALPIALSLTHEVGADTWNRQPWDSTIYSGSLTDFVLGSPFVTSLVPRLETLLPATSRELSVVGGIPALAAIAAIVIALTAYLRFTAEDRRRIGWLLVLLQIALLTFVTLGLGTTQEALLSLVGIESPLRGWSRLTILIAIIGIVLVSPWLSDRAEEARGRWRIAPILVGALIVAIAVLDARSTLMAPPRAVPTLEEKPALAYLDANVGDCPVAQLPVGTFPDYPMADGSDVALSYYYRGFVPYILEPDRTWSYGAALGTESDSLMRSLPPTVTAAELQRLRSAGYCAVLYDNEYAQWLRDRGLNWSGQSMQEVAPSWSGQRFDVYALPG